MEALQQRVVQLPRDSRACVLRPVRRASGQRVLHLAHPIPVSRPQERHERNRGDCAKPGRLVVRRSDGERQRCGASFQTPSLLAAITRNGTSRRHIGVERLPPQTGLTPTVVVAIELVAKLDLLIEKVGDV